METQSSSQTTRARPGKAERVETTSDRKDDKPAGAR
jgi:hypothetical protein